MTTQYIVCRPEMKSIVENSKLPIIVSMLTKTIQTKFPRINKRKTRITKKFTKKYTVVWPDYSFYMVTQED